jgi:hypothetical protein
LGLQGLPRPTEAIRVAGLSSPTALVVVISALATDQLGVGLYLTARSAAALLL